MDDLLGIRDLFREEARTIVDRLRQRLPELASDLADGRGLADVVADGVALKGSGALVGLPVVSRAGVLVVRAAELVAERMPHDLGTATTVVDALRASLGALERLLDGCLDDDAATQETILTEMLGQFSPRDRSLLRSTIEGEGGLAPAEGESGRIDSDTLDGIASALTDVLIAETQLGGVERDLETLAAALDPAATGAGTAGPTREVVATLASRAAPARALARAAAELHRRLQEIGLGATALESLVVLHVGDARYALPADDVQALVPAAGDVPSDSIGRTSVSVDGQPLPALDLATCLGHVMTRAPALAAVIAVGGARSALLVARAEVPRLMVLRPLDPLVATHPLLRNTTVGPRGEVVFVLRAAALVGVLQGTVTVPLDSAHPSPRA